MWGLVVRATLRRARRRLRAGPLYRWRFSGRTPDRVLIAPPDLRLPDKQIADEIYHGRFALSGHMVDTGGDSPFQIEVADAEWLKSLHGFRWLRHMREAGTDLSAANARALVGDWMATHGRRIGGVAWDPAITARRIIAWLQHSTVVLQAADYNLYRAYLKSLAMQVRYLRVVAADIADAEERLRARAALCYAALSLPVAQPVQRQATRQLSLELDRQILPDGCHVSRNPQAVLELLADLLPLRYTYAAQAEAPPPQLIAAVERMLPALRFFRHQDGTLALFNGMGATAPDRLAAILRHDDTAGQPLARMPYAGYDRLAMDTTTVIADTGLPPPLDQSHEAHAGCLSFEMSSSRQRFVVNCGVDAFGADDFRPLSRATAAHSTATLNDTSQARFVLTPQISDLVGTPLSGGPKKVEVRREDSDGIQGFTASHDAYVSRFGLWHERQLALAGEGRILEGTDRFFRAKGGSVPNDGRDAVAVRFHLHPAVGLFRDRDDRMVLKASAGDLWIFDCKDVEPTVEESIYFAALGGPRKSRQIVLSFRASQLAEVSWRFTRISRAG
ncbi:MAG: heparinase II/III family protein [Rhizobiaceae bacterium]|nr:heparinase II/III family protein [Rhizobiaceae bacterium]